MRAALLLLNVSWALCCLAQTGPPGIQRVEPRGLRPGSEVRLVIEGKNLDGASHIVFQDPGIAGTIDEVKVLSKGAKSQPVDRAPVEDDSTACRVTVTVRVPAGAAAGRQMFRLHTALGSTNTAAVDVANLPVSDADRVPLPATVEGVLKNPGDVRDVAFEAAAGQAVVFDLVARRIESRLSGDLALLDAEGKRIPASTIPRDGDVALYHVFDRAGLYRIRIQDHLLGGGRDHFFRLHMGRLPLAARTFPRGLQIGAASRVELSGVNLAETSVTITPPAGLHEGDRFTRDGAAFIATRHPALTIASPGRDAAGASAFKAPVAVNSRVEIAGGSWYRFHARKGVTLNFDVFAQRIGSPLDPVIEIRDGAGNPVRTAYLRATMKTALTRLARVTAPILDVETVGNFRAGDYAWMNGELLRVSTVDTTTSPMIVFDGETRRRAHSFTTALQHPIGETIYRVEVLPPDRPASPRGLPVFELFANNDDGGAGYGRDSHLEFTPPADGDYFAVVRDARGANGPDHIFVLTAQPGEPDFDLSVSPTNPNVPAGGRIPITVTASRAGGFDGPIQLRFDGLPRGVRALPDRIPEGRSSVTVALEASTDAESGAFPFRMIGTAGIDGRNVERIAHSGEPGLDSLSVVRAPADVLITLEPAEVVLEPGKFTKARVRIERAPGYDDRVPIRVVGLPMGVFVRGTNDGPGIIIHEKSLEADIEIEADPAAPPAALEIFASGNVETTSPIQQRHVSRPVRFRVVQAASAAR